MFNDLVEKDIKLMEEEIDHRIKIVRPKFSQMIRDAKELGDLSENAEYHEARREKGKNEGRINFLRGMIRTANIIKPNPNKNEVGIFDRVEVYFEDEDETEVFQLSTTMRHNASKNIISKESPLGKTLWGRKIGERLKVEVNKDVSYFVLIKDIKKSQVDDIDLPLS